MESQQLVLQNIFSIQKNTLEHLKDIQKQSISYNKQIFDDLNVFVEFSENIHKLTSDYYLKFLNHIQKYQSKFHSQVQAENLKKAFSNYMHSIVINLEEYYQQFLQTEELSNNFKKKLKNFQFQNKNLIGSFSSNIQEVMKYFDEIQIKYKFQIKEDEKKLKESFKNYDNFFQDEILDLKSKIKSLQTKEQNIYDEFIDTLNQKVKVYNISSEIQSVETIKINGYFNRIYQKLDVFKDTEINALQYQFQFTDQSQFLNLNSIYQQKYTLYLCKQMKLHGKKINSDQKLFFDIFVQKMFLEKNLVLSQTLLIQFQKIIQNEEPLKYFIYLIILKKRELKFMKNYNNEFYQGKQQFKNFIQISQYFLLIWEKNYEIYFESIYHYLKFCQQLINKQRCSLLESLKKILLFHQTTFWFKFFEFMVSYFKENLKKNGIFKFDNLVNQFSQAQFISGVKNFVSQGINQQKKNKLICEKKAFEELSTILFQINLDYEIIIEIVMAIYHNYQIKLDEIKNVLVKNQDLIHSQVLNNYQIIQTNRFIKFNKEYSQQQKICLVFKKMIDFLETPKDLFKLLILNKFYYSRKKKFIKSILYQRKIKNKKLRTLLLENLIEVKINKLNDYNDFCSDGQIIILDVKRTFINSKEFKKDGLIKILKNISNKEKGNFSYYQGLNYLTCYFYLQFKQDELKTYSFMIQILKKKFNQYVDQDLNGLKKLFFFLKKLMKIYLPNLINYLESELKLDIEVIFASWCLTLFTTIVQYEQNSELLDDILDVFVGKGWIGFLQVILVLLERIQCLIFDKNFEDTIMVLTDISKNNFKLIYDVDSSFQLKDNMKRFKNIDNNLIAQLNGEYGLIKEKIDDFWFKLNNTLQLIQYNYKIVN